MAQCDRIFGRGGRCRADRDGLRPGCDRRSSTAVGDEILRSAARNPGQRGIELGEVHRVVVAGARGDIHDPPLVPARSHRDRIGLIGDRTGADRHCIERGRLRAIAQRQRAVGRSQRVCTQRHGVVAGRLRAVFGVGGEFEAVVRAPRYAAIAGIVVTVAADGDCALGAAAGERAQRDSVRACGGDLRAAALGQRIGARGEGRLGDRVAIIVYAIVDLRTECQRVRAARTGAKTNGERTAAGGGAALSKRHRKRTARAALETQCRRTAARSFGGITQSDPRIGRLRRLADCNGATGRRDSADRGVMAYRNACTDIGGRIVSQGKGKIVVGC